MGSNSIGGAAISLNRKGPVIDYTSLDFDSIADDLKRFAQASFSDRWTDFNPDQFAVVFLDLIAYSHDMLTFYLNATLRSITVQNAQVRQDLVNLAKTYDYFLASASAASGPLQLVFRGASLPFTLSAHAQFSAGTVFFQPDQDYPLTIANATSGPDVQGNYTFGGTAAKAKVGLNVIEGREYQNVALGLSDGTREQSFSLPQRPLIDGTLLVSVNGIQWDLVHSLIKYGPSSQVVRYDTDDSDLTTIFFGDNVNGKIPPVGQPITATWKTGGGRRGRVGANTQLSAVTSIAGLVNATLPEGTTGGEDKETLNHARSAIPASLSQGDRAVTLRDYAITALKASPNVAKAVAMQNQVKLVNIAIAPQGGGIASDALKAEVSQYVDLRRMVGRRARMSDPVYVACALSVDVFVEPSVQRDVVAAVTRALFLTPDPTLPQVGVFDFPNVGFGARDDDGKPQLTVQRMYEVLLGLRSYGVQNTLLTRFDTSAAARSIGAVSHGNGTFTFLTLDPLARKRRQWRVQFISSTTYRVFERAWGESTSLTPTLLTDDRTQLSALPGPLKKAVVKPNIRQTATFPVGSYPAPTQVLKGAGPGDFFSVASKGDTYYIEWPADPPQGTVGASYTPRDVLTGLDEGIQWKFTAGTSAWSPGDAYLITVFESVSDIILADDEIPTLDPSNLVVNVKTAV
jgi:uncharacterized phage protein gp47/JayE